MRKRRASAAGCLVVALVVAVLILVVAASGGSSAGGGGLSFGRSLQHVRERNLKLQSMIAVLTEQQTLRIGGYRDGQSSLPHPAAPVVSRKAVSAPAPAASSATQGACDSNYEGACLDPNANDYDCEGGSGDGPYYTGEVRVVGVDHYGLDSNGNGVGCESE